MFLKRRRYLTSPDGGVRRELMPASDIRIPGAHNVYNMMMAAAVGCRVMLSDDDIRAVATTFGGVEHRIEFVREGRREVL